ncbi:MAG: Gfo/Idh/MocA family oxidoreductase [Chthoniobacteraceae bacterium]
MNAETPIQIALIGAGGVGAYHLETIENFEAAGRIQLAAVADPTVSRFPEVRDRLTARGVRWYLDYREMLRAEQSLQAVTIATPIPFHLDMARECIAHGLYVNLEKPPVPLIGQLESLIAADAAQRVNVGFQMICSRAVQLLKESIVSGQLGEVQEIRAAAAWPRKASYYQRASWAGKLTLNGLPVFDGPATNALAHVVQNIMYFASPQAGGFDTPVEIQGELYRARKIESYDSASMRGTFSSGIKFTAAFAHTTQETLPYHIEVIGSKGSARVVNDGNRFENCTSQEDCPEDTKLLLRKTLDEFLLRINGQRKHFPNSLTDTRGYVIATNGILLSSGGIHDIDPKWIQSFGDASDEGMEVEGMFEAVKQSLETGKLFSELNLPWAVPSSMISLANTAEISQKVVESLAAL